MKRITVIGLVVVILLIPIMGLGCDSDGDNGGNGSNANPVSWATDYVSLEADDFYIVADGEKYYANVGYIDVDSDPPEPWYEDTTLEVKWQESGVEMRLYIYFYTDNTHWWSDEIRTYDGQENGDWICYIGEFFKSSLGTAFKDDVVLQAEVGGGNWGNDYSGEIHFDNLTLQAFLNYNP